MQWKAHGRDLTIRDISPWIILACLLGMLPYLVAWLVAPDDLVFTGALVNPDDAAIYFSAIRQGAAGNWLFIPNFSPEQWPPLLGYLVYLALGQLARMLGGEQQFWFHLFRLLSSLFTLLALLLWVRVAFPLHRRQQLTAWLLLVLGGGIGWLMVVLVGYQKVPLPDVLSPEWSTVTVLLGPPHYILGLGFEVILLSSAIQITRRIRGPKWTFVGFFAALGLAVTYPYAAITSGLVIGFQMLHLAVQEKRIPFSRWLRASVLILPMLLLLLYYGLWMLRNSYYQSTHVTENFVRGPGVIGILIGFGILLPLALVGSRLWLHQKKVWIVPLWAVVNLFMLFIPVTFAGDFALGFLVPVATLAAYGLEEVILPWIGSTSFFDHFGKLSPTPYDSLRRVFLILVFPSVLMVSLLVTRWTSLRFEFPAYLPRSDIVAAEWLSSRVDEDDLILSYYPLGNYLPRALPGRVFLGQKFMTPELDHKLSLVESFWDPTTSDAWREDLLNEWQVDFIYEGHYEKELYVGEITLPGQIIYDEESVTIYQLNNE